MAQSTVLPVGAIVAKRLRVAKSSAGVAPPSKGPGWTIASPIAAAFWFAMTWLLLSRQSVLVGVVDNPRPQRPGRDGRVSDADPGRCRSHSCRE